MSQILRDKTSAGTGDILFLGRIYEDHTVEINWTGTDPTAMTVVLMGRISENGSMIDIATYALTAGDLSAKKAMFHVASKPLRDVQLDIRVLTGGAASIQGFYAGAEI